MKKRLSLYLFILYLFVLLIPAIPANAADVEVVNENFNTITSFPYNGWSNLANTIIVNPGYSNTKSIGFSSSGGAYTCKDIGSTNEITNGIVSFETYYKSDAGGAAGDRYPFAFWNGPTFSQINGFYPLKVDAANNVRIYDNTTVLKQVDYDWHKYKIVLRLTFEATASSNNKVEVLGVYIDDQLCTNLSYPRITTGNRAPYNGIRFVGARNWVAASVAIDNYKFIRIDNGNTLPTPSIIGDPKFARISLSFSNSVDITTITSSNIIVSKNSTVITPTIMVNDKTVSLTGLEAGTQYNVTVKSGSSGVKDWSGNTLSSDYSTNVTTGKYYLDENFNSITSWPVGWNRSNVTNVDFTNSGYEQGGIYINNSSGYGYKKLDGVIQNGIVVLETQYKKNATVTAGGEFYPFAWWADGNATGTGYYPIKINNNNNVLISDGTNSILKTVDNSWHKYKMVLRLTYIGNNNAGNKVELLGVYIDGNLCDLTYPKVLSTTYTKSAYNGMSSVGFQNIDSATSYIDNYKMYSYDTGMVDSMPINGGVNIPVNTAVYIPYDGLIDISTVNSTCLSVYNGEIQSANKLSVSDFTYACYNDKIYIHFINNLEYESNYNIVISDNVLDIKGVSLGRTIMFRTVSFSPIDVEYKTYLVVGEQEQEVQTLQAGTIRSKIKISNNLTQSVSSGVVFIALYEKNTNKMVGYSRINAQDISVGSDLTVMGDVVVPADYTNYKIDILLWDSNETMRPNIPLYEIK